MSKTFSYLFLIVFIFLQFVPYLAAEADSAPTVTLTGARISNLLCNAMSWMFWILISLSIIMVIFAAYLYVSSGGSPDSVSKANKTIMYAAIGVAVALIARGVPTLVSAFIGSSSITVCQ